VKVARAMTYIVKYRIGKFVSMVIGGEGLQRM